MIVALLVLSLAMILSGLLAMILGWDIVVIERGWAMVIAGSISASGGAVLLGLVAVISRLAHIQSELGHLRERAPDAELPLPPSPVIDPVSLLANGLLDGAGSKDLKAGEKASEKREEPRPPAFEQPAGRAPEPARPEAPGGVSGEGSPSPKSVSEERAADAPSPEPERSPAVPEDMFADHKDDKADEADEEDEDLPESARPPWARGPEVEPPKPDWARDKTDAAPEKPEPAPAPAGATPATPASRSAVIGTYNSGGNRYVMFADGSIEAETPDGTFKFASLDELKEFIASGGESGGST